MPTTTPTCGTVGDSCLRLGFLGVDQFRDAEVQDLHAAVEREEQVLGLQITMDDAAGVRGRESARHLHAAIDGLAQSQRAVTQAGAQGFALEELGDDVRDIALAPDVVTTNRLG